MLLYALLISFPVKHTDHFRFDGRICIGDLMAHTMVWKFCAVNVIVKVLSTGEPNFQKKATNFSYKTEQQELVFARVFIWGFWVSNRYF